MTRLESLAPGVWRLPLRTPTIPPATTTNVMVVGGSRLAIIEPATPFADERRVLDEALEALAAEGRQVALLVVTHHHPDHVGDVERLRQRLSVPVYAHPRTAERVRWPVDCLLEDGDAIELGDGMRLVAVHTPGHAPGHLVLHEPTSGLAHAGDMVAGEGTIIVDPDDAGDMAHYLGSLARLRGLGARALVPAHGPVIDDPQGLCDHYVRHRLAREARVLAAIDAGAEDQAALLQHAYADTPRALWGLAARSLEAHLRKLEGDGAIVRSGGAARRRA